MYKIINGEFVWDSMTIRGDLTVTSNIIVGGTVDGVDISAIALDNQPASSTSDITCDNQSLINVNDIEFWTDGVNLGASGAEIATAYINQIKSDTGTVDFDNENLETDGMLQLNSDTAGVAMQFSIDSGATWDYGMIECIGAAHGIIVKCDNAKYFEPEGNNTYELGESGFDWKKIWVRELDNGANHLDMTCVLDMNSNHIEGVNVLTASSITCTGGISCLGITTSGQVAGSSSFNTNQIDCDFIIYGNGVTAYTYDAGAGTHTFTSPVEIAGAAGDSVLHFSVTAEDYYIGIDNSVANDPLCISLNSDLTSPMFSMTPTSQRIVVGFSSTATGNDALSLGNSITNSGVRGTAIGYNNSIAGNWYNTVIGYDNALSGANSITCVGVSNTPTGVTSTTVGYYNRTITGNTCITCGVSCNNRATEALCMGSRSETFANATRAAVLGGWGPVAYGAYSLSQGYYAKSQAYGESVFGLWSVNYGAANQTAYAVGDPIHRISDGNGSAHDCFTILKGHNTPASGHFTMTYDVTIGEGSAGYDYSILFNGETHDMRITAMEDEAGFEFKCETADTNVRMQFYGTSNTGYYTWDEDNDAFFFNDDILMLNGEKIYFRDANSSIYDDATNLIIASNGRILLDCNSDAQCVRIAGSDAANDYADIYVDGNSDLYLIPNTGVLAFGTHAAIGAETITGYIAIKDAAGVNRKIAVVS